MSTKHLRTNLFRFDPAQLGHVYQSVVDPEFYEAWRAIEAVAPFKERNLPTRGLQELLAVISKGPVKANPRPSPRADAAALLMLNEIPLSILNEALEIWGEEVLKSYRHSLPGIAKRLVVKELIPLEAEMLFTPSATKGGAYAVIPWLVGQRMAAKPMKTQPGAPVKLFETADYRHNRDGMTLLTWDTPILAAEQGEIAHHALDLKLSMLPGHQKPYLDLRVHINRVMPNWVGKKLHAWVNSNNGIVCCRVKTPPAVDGKWVTHYVHPTSRILGYLGFDPLPAIVEGDIPTDSSIRPIFATTPSNAAIGAGAGPLFFDEASFHLTECVPGTEPMLAQRMISGFRQKRLIGESALPTLPVMVLASSADLVMRLHEATQDLATQAKLFKRLEAPTFELKRLSVPEAATHLLQPCESDASMEAWFKSEVLPEIQRTSAQVVIVETTPELARRKQGDPKHKLRDLFARHGVRTQFIFHPPIKSKRVRRGKLDADHPALNALIECIRLHGLIPMPLPEAPRLASNTMILSVYLERISEEGGYIHLPVITRIETGSQRAEVFWGSDEDGSVGRWYPYGDAAALIHSTRKLFSEQEVMRLVNQAFLAPRRALQQPLIVCLDKGLARIYKALQDAPAGNLPPIPADAAVVRVRCDENSALVTGNHSKSPATPAHIGNHIGLYSAEDDHRVHYFVSPSRHYNKESSHRNANRYSADEGLDKPWHQLGVTELVALQLGAFQSEAVVAEGIGLLCRHAPLWDWYIRLPGPMHLGKKIAADHPYVESQRSSFA